MVIFWARCCIILFFKKIIRVALESRTLIWVPLLQAMTLNKLFSYHESRLLSRSLALVTILIFDLSTKRSVMWPKITQNDLWPHLCCGHICNSTLKRSLLPSTFFFQNLTETPHTYITFIYIKYYVQNEWLYSFFFSEQSSGKTTIGYTHGHQRNRTRRLEVCKFICACQQHHNNKVPITLLLVSAY